MRCRKALFVLVMLLLSAAFSACSNAQDSFEQSDSPADNQDKEILLDPTSKSESTAESLSNEEITRPEENFATYSAEQCIVFLKEHNVEIPDGDWDEFVKDVFHKVAENPAVKFSFGAPELQELADQIKKALLSELPSAIDYQVQKEALFEKLTASYPQLSQSLKDHWNNWERLSPDERTGFPDREEKLFGDWQSAEAYLGRKIRNPLGQIPWLEKNNYSIAAETDVLSETEAPVQLLWIGNREGQIEQLLIRAGYSDGQIGMTLQADLSGRTFRDDTASELHLQNGLIVTRRESRAEANPFIAISFRLEDVSYTIYLKSQSGKESMAAACERLLEELGR